VLQDYCSNRLPEDTVGFGKELHRKECYGRNGGKFPTARYLP